MKNFTFKVQGKHTLQLFISVLFLFLLFPAASKAQCTGDVTLPVISNCGTSASSTNTAGQCGHIFTYAYPTATDNCQPSVVIPFTNEVHAATSYTENGYTVSTTRRINVFAAVGVANNPIIAPETLPATWTLTNNNGHNFTMVSIEAGAFNLTSNPQTLNFVGVKGDGSTVSYSFTTTAAYGTMELISFPAGFTDLVSMHWDATINIYDNFRMITLPKIVRTSGLASGSLFPVGTTTTTYTATDDAGNTATCSFTYTVTDDEAPTFTAPVNKTIYTDAVCNFNATPANTGIPTNVHDNCGGTLIPGYTDVVADGSCPGSHIITRTWTLADSHSNQAVPKTQTITVLDNTPPQLRSTLPGGAQGNLCKSAAPAAPSVASIAALYSDNCSSVTATLLSSVPTGDNCAWTVTYTYSIVDACGNAAPNAVIVYTGGDTEAPTFTAPPDITIPFTSTCGYDASTANTGDVTNEHDNCSVNLQATYIDISTTQCGYNIVILRKWHLVDDCGYAAPDKVQTITVSDNNTPYIIYASMEANFGEKNYIAGDVGVTSVTGKAQFKKNTILDPYNVRAKNITVDPNATVNNRVFSPATGGPNPPFYPFTGNPAVLTDYNVTVSTAVPISANYKNLTIKKGVSCTVTGTLYGHITQEEGSVVTYNPVGGVLNVQEFNAKGNKDNPTTKQIFSNCTSMRISQHVDITDNDWFNVGGPKVTVYCGDDNKDGEDFHVHGKNSIVTANIYIPIGELHVDATDDNSTAVMNGWFIVQKLHSDSKNIYWNKYTCTPPVPFAANRQPVTDDAIIAVPVKALFDVNAYPNPTRSDFSLEIKGFDQAKPVLVRITDMSGRLIITKTAVAAKGSLIRIGEGLTAGSYFAEISQGADHRVIKLVKQD